MPRATLPDPLLRSLLWQHFKWHLGVGFAIWTGLVSVFISYQYNMAKHAILADDFYTKNNFQTEALTNKAHEMAENGIFLLIGGFLLAVVGGLLQKPVLAVLCRQARTPSALVWQSFILFELSIFLLALIPWPIAYNTFSWDTIQRQFLIFFMGSLPWLLTTGIASHRLATALRRPSAATEPA